MVLVLEAEDATDEERSGGVAASSDSAAVPCSSSSLASDGSGALAATARPVAGRSAYGSAPPCVTNR